jgi:hypothetical protein
MNDNRILGCWSIGGISFLRRERGPTLMSEDGITWTQQLRINGNKRRGI